MDKVKEFLFYAGLKPNQYKQIKSEIQKSNLQNLKIFTVVAFSFLMVMFVLSFLVSDVKGNRWFYYVPLLIFMIIFAISKYCSLKEIHLLVCIYVFMGALYSFGGTLGTIATPDEQAVTFVALLLTVPLLFTDRPIRMICYIYFFAILFIIEAISFKEKHVLVTDIIDVCVFGTISAIISSYMMMVKCQRYLYEHEAAVVSEIDLLTELHNRNSFEQRIKTYPSSCKKSLCCVYADVNGLHELNNTKGHEAGDKMLKFIAGSLKQQFGAEDVYRIGGDEFVAFAIDSDYDSVKRSLGELKRSAENNGYYISIGHDLQACAELDMDSLIKSAEKKMYEEKELYYEELGRKETMWSEQRQV